MHSERRDLQKGFALDEAQARGHLRAALGVRADAENLGSVYCVHAPLADVSRGGALYAES